MAMLLGLSLIVAAAVHTMWLMRKRSAKFPAIGTRWSYGTYMKRYVAEVLHHHPLTNEITVSRTEDGNPRSPRVLMRMDPAKLMSTALPYKEKRSP